MVEIRNSPRGDCFVVHHQYFFYLADNTELQTHCKTLRDHQTGAAECFHFILLIGQCGIVSFIERKLSLCFPSGLLLHFISTDLQVGMKSEHQNVLKLCECLTKEVNYHSEVKLVCGNRAFPFNCQDNLTSGCENESIGIKLTFPAVK